MENTKDGSQRPKNIINVYDLVTKKDLDEFKQELLFSLVQAMKANSVKPAKKWIKTHELKKLLNISNGTLHTMRYNGTIPFTKIGNTLYYNMDDLERVFQEKKRHYLKGVLPPLKRK